MNMYANEKIDGQKVLRLSKMRARKLFNEGRIIFIIPNKCRLDNMWVRPMRIQKSEEVSFDTLVNSAIFYNCCSELGYYLRYYVLESNS